jgi:hypothetical protein
MYRDLGITDLPSECNRGVSPVNADVSPPADQLILKELSSELPTQDLD